MHLHNIVNMQVRSLPTTDIFIFVGDRTERQHAVMLCCRNLPLASWISCTLVTVIYVFANVAYFTAVTPVEVIESSAVAVVSFMFLS